MDRKILFVDGDQSSRHRFSDEIKRTDGLVVETSPSVEDAGSELESYRPECIVIGELQQGLEELFEKADEQRPAPVKILFSDDSLEQVSEDDTAMFSAFVPKSGEEGYEELVGKINSLMQDRSELGFPVPEDEEERLGYIRKYDLESLVESDDFDRLARIGAEYFGTKWCFVGIIGEEDEKFLSFRNSDTEELKRSCSICTFTISDDEVMVVDDRKEDPRFKYVDELDDLGINWYAGAPIKTEEGYRIGAFCVADPDQKEFSEKDKEMLQLMADEAKDKIELKKSGSETWIDRLRDFL